MAEKKEAKLKISLEDNVSDALKKMKLSTLALTSAVAGLGAFLIDSLKSFMDSDKVVVKLNASLKAQGIYTEQLSKEMQKFAGELQKQTIFSDEAIISSQNLLTTFGLAGRQMKEATIAAANLASGLGIDLQTATLLVGKASTGATESLGRYGLKIDETIPAGEKFGALLKEINGRFGGAAQAEADSYAGRMENLKNRFDDVKEQIGEALTPALDKALTFIESFIGGLEQLGGVFPAVFAVGLSVIKDFVTVLGMVVEKIPFLSESLGLVGLNFTEVTTAIQAQIDNIITLGIQEQQTNQKRVLDSNITTAQFIANQKRLATESAAALKKKEEDERKHQKEIKAQRDAGFQAYRENEEKVRLNDQLTLQQRRENFKSTMNFISSLSTSKNKELAAIGKAAAITTATIDTYAAANKALASAPPPWNIALAALVTAAGFANVARISGVALAQGGVVLPRSGGTQATIGEAGRAEAVIPLGDDRASEKMREAGLGNTVNINLNVGTLVGSEDNVRTLAKMIDQELFSLRRNNESVAFEAL